MKHSDVPGADALAELTARIAALERTMGAAGRSLEGHTAWLHGLQQGAVDVAGSLPGVEARVTAHDAWLAQLERWVTSCVRTLADLGGQPLADITPGAAGVPSVAATLMRRLEVWTVMSWLDHAVPVDDSTLVTVITATRNRPEHVSRAIASVLAQRHQNFEHVVVDDSDDDSTASVLGQITDSRVQVVRAPVRRGLGAALNIGLGAATGDVVTFLDDDNVMHPMWLHSLAWAFARWPHAQSLYGARVIEDGAARNGSPGLMLPSMEFHSYDRERHETANFIDQNTIAHRREGCAITFSETLTSAVDWERSLRLFATGAPLVLPAISCFYGTVSPNRLSDNPDRPEMIRRVRAAAHLTRPLRVVVDTAMYPVLSETYITEEIRALTGAGADVIPYADADAVSRDETAPAVDRDFDALVARHRPDVVVLEWATHAKGALPRMEAHRLPFAVRVHSYDAAADRVEALLRHPLCVGAFAYPHLLPTLPAGVRPLRPVMTRHMAIPTSTSRRPLILSASAGVPKRNWPLLFDALGRLPDLERIVIVARSNGLENVPDEIAAYADEMAKGVQVRIDVPRAEVLGLIAEAAALVYTLDAAEVMGHPMSIVEAMLCGTIVIAPDRPEAWATVGPELRAYGEAADIERHARAAVRGGPESERDRTALRARAETCRSPEALGALHEGLRDALRAWRYAQG